jgi:hypothetical protein
MSDRKRSSGKMRLLTEGPRARHGLWLAGRVSPVGREFVRPTIQLGLANMAVHGHFSVPQARHSLSGLNREHSLTDAIKMREHSRRHKDAISFGTRGSQVQILPLRPVFSKRRCLRGLIWERNSMSPLDHDVTGRSGQARARRSRQAGTAIRPQLPPTKFRQSGGRRISRYPWEWSEFSLGVG